MDQFSTSFVLVNYFSEVHTLHSLEHIAAQTNRCNFETIVIDNNSGLIVEHFKKEWPNTKVVLASRNLGYGAACDLASKQATGKYLFFLNNDTELLNDAAGILSAYLESHPDVALVGPQLLDKAGKHIPSFDYFPTLASKFFGVGILRLFFPDRFPRKDGSVKTPTEVDLVAGAALFIRADVYRSIGGFDPQFFLYCEEEDLAFRVRATGHKVVFVPEARVMHVGGGSSKNQTALKKEFYISFFKFYRKHYGALKTRVIKLICLNQFVWRYLLRDEKPLWKSLLSWMLRGAPESESLRYEAGNIDGPGVPEHFVPKKTCSTLLGLILLLGAHGVHADGVGNMAAGMEAFQERRWTQAMGDFIEVLRVDPTNAQAHAYLTTIAQQMKTDQRLKSRQDRIEILNDAAQRLKNSRADAHSLEIALDDSMHSEENTKKERWHAACDQARLEQQMGHLLGANDIVLKVLAENASYPEAQRELSDLQSLFHTELEQDTGLPILQRYAYEGFYAYGQADYKASVTAWNKALALIGTDSPEEAVHERQSLHFDAYLKVAQAHVDDEDLQAKAKVMFDQAVALYQKGRPAEALELFRRVAIQDPNRPQLAYYLVQAESSAEKDRARRLGESKRGEIAQLFQQAMNYLEKEQYKPAEDILARIVKLDPTHPQAQSYLTMVRAEIQRRNDPKAAQMHYENGLIAYASGKLDEAVREWTIAVRMDPSHDKAVLALNKAQKELALSKETL